MSKPVHGDNKHDKNALLLIAEINKMNASFCKNLDLVKLKKLAKTAKYALAEIEDAIVTKQQQSVGGVKGTRVRDRS